jgi:hypothetical protein
LGGAGEGPLDSIERAAIHADGSLGPFELAGVHLTTARQGHSLVLAGDYLYVIGGAAGSTALDSVERAPIDAAGVVGAFAPVAGVTLATARAGQTTVVLGHALYVVGGNGAGGPLNKIERAALDPEGLAAPFVAQDRTLNLARHDHASVVVGNYLYLIGGETGGIVGDLERVSLNVSGQITGPSSVAAALIVPRAELTATVIGPYLYVIGGSTTSANTIERATIRADGTLDPFVTVPDVALVTPRRSHIAAVIGAYLYVVGGTGAAGPLSTIERAAIRPDGSLGPFANSNALSGVRTTHSAVVLGNYLYLLGGADSSGPLASLERIAINPDGTLGASTTFPAALPSPHGGRQNVVVRSSLYVLAGESDRVERATINADGTLGTFTSLSNALLRSTEHYEATVALVGQVLYVLGGLIESGLGASEFTGVSLSGTLSTFGELAIVTPRSGHASVLLGNQLYLLGGTGMLGSPGVEAYTLR